MDSADLPIPRFLLQSHGTDVLDVRIVVRWAAIYAMLTSATSFAWTKLAAFGEIGVAVVLGLALNPLHRRLERAVDAAICFWPCLGRRFF